MNFDEETINWLDKLARLNSITISDVIAIIIDVCCEVVERKSTRSKIEFIITLLESGVWMGVVPSLRLSVHEIKTEMILSGIRYDYSKL